MDMDMGDHGDMDMGKCNMNMLFTWSTKDLCIVFSQWHITGPLSLLVSLVAIVLLTAGYEGVRNVTRQYEATHTQRLRAFSAGSATTDAETGDQLPATASFTAGPNQTILDASSPLLVGRDNQKAVEQKGKIVMAALYAVQVFYSFFIMLLFMTYNGLVMLAVAVGAFVGYLAFGEGMTATKTVACH
ncbi:hypothetical protein ASPZODRAFT_62843 [Penicilliopsis zonata CBS 506.65]|uniref:Copper transport protein n=1 Tax=Penicilliopsis zonata CBS 506.65 TaxID=1073090 RepID=A0A1L9SNC5_9EURO|nr:hypothetical protein ASPZODRAFT_62843 [Penicilliopsis zonata CBS 506.65]OJJ48554.1 hypothetical protein ASPZODRAFT_62843 [Penicilliopsis zonata CBS 506.65]